MQGREKNCSNFVCTVQIRATAHACDRRTPNSGAAVTNALPEDAWVRRPRLQEISFIKDSWSVCVDSTILNQKESSVDDTAWNYTTLTTGQGFFSVGGNIFRRVSERIFCDRTTQFLILQRDSTLTIQLFTRYQFSYPRFRNLITYS